MSKPCEYYEALIFAMSDEGLTDGEAAELREHLKSCPDCRRLFSAFADAAGVLKNDQAEPPAALREGVMARVLAYEKVRGDMTPETETMPAEDPISPAAEAENEPGEAPVSMEAARRKIRTGGKARRWIPVAAAACLIAVLGGGAVLARLHGPWGASNAAREAITMEEAPAAVSEPFPAAAANGAAEAMKSAPEAPMEFEAAAEEAAPVHLPEEEVTMADRTEADAAAGADAALFAATDAGRPVYTREAPARVPEGREEDFQALLGAADMPEGLTEADFRVFAAVEFHGVIYEFLQDETETAMLWRDAAESAYALPSPGVPADLWDILSE